MGEYRYKLPDIGEGVVEAEITAWHVALGDEVEEDAPIADAMTDKATIELTAPVSGVIKMVACEEGDILAVGADLVIFETEGDEAGDVTIEASSMDAKLAAEASPKAAPKATSNPSPGGKVLAAPAVRKSAAEKGLDLSKAKPTGKDGEITHADLALLEKSFAQEEGETRIKVIGLRRVIAQRMQEAKRHIPHFTYVEEIDMTALEELRKRANEKKSEDKPKLTVLPFIIRALAKTLEDWPQFNARYTGATTTLTSLGPLGGIVTTPVINRPEVAIFGPNKIRKKLFLEDGEIAERLVMNFSVSCDHRVIDGYDAAKIIVRSVVQVHLSLPSFARKCGI